MQINLPYAIAGMIAFSSAFIQESEARMVAIPTKANVARSNAPVKRDSDYTSAGPGIYASPTISSPISNPPSQQSSYSYQWERPLGNIGSMGLSALGGGLPLGGAGLSSLGGPGLSSLGGPGLSSLGGSGLSSLGGAGLPSLGGATLPSLGGSGLPLTGGMGLPLGAGGFNGLPYAGQPHPIEGLIPGIGRSSNEAPITTHYQGFPHYIPGRMESLPISQLVDPPSNLPISRETNIVQSPSGPIPGSGFVNDDKVDGIVHKISHYFQTLPGVHNNEGPSTLTGQPNHHYEAQPESVVSATDRKSPEVNDER